MHAPPAHTSSSRGAPVAGSPARARRFSARRSRSSASALRSSGAAAGAISPIATLTAGVRRARLGAQALEQLAYAGSREVAVHLVVCLLYTSDAADEEDSV